MCLGIYRDPKFLPCHHSFCAACVRDWAGRHGGTAFPCPACRKTTSLPAGGAAALQSNFYLSADELERARRGTLCLVHSQKEVEFFCVPCQRAICISCKLTEHEGHPTQDLRKAEELVKTRLLGDRPRVQNAATELTRRVTAVRGEQRTLQDQKTAVEATIRARHAALVAAANEARDQELRSLRALNAELQGGLAADLDGLQTTLDQAAQLDRRLDQVLKRGAPSELLAAAKEMTDGGGSHQSVQQLISSVPRRRAAGQLAFKPGNKSDNMEAHMRSYMGTVCKMETEGATKGDGDV